MHATRGFHRGAYNRMYFLFIGRWTYNWGGGGRGLSAAFMAVYDSLTAVYTLSWPPRAFVVG